MRRSRVLANRSKNRLAFSSFSPMGPTSQSSRTVSTFFPRAIFQYWVSQSSGCCLEGRAMRIPGTASRTRRHSENRSERIYIFDPKAVKFQVIHLDFYERLHNGSSVSDSFSENGNVMDANKGSGFHYLHGYIHACLKGAGKFFFQKDCAALTQVFPVEWG